MTATLIPLRPAPARPRPHTTPTIPTTPAPARSSRRPLWLVAGVFLLPLALGWGLFFLGWQPTGQPHGALLQPPQPLPAALAADDARGRWQVLLVGRGPCASDCLAARRALTQLRATLGKYADRVSLREVAAPQADLPVAALPPGAAGTAAGAPLPAYRFYLADPAGRLILAYPADVPWNDLRQDLERLLKYSWVG
ncbi:hypothetical protein OTERR_03670 [Oryzomicrobium terrae]|uniref:Transmembrane protein n=1 Tax=Oryzomicrobium terrae TaxID=1735038 RepID=A0A5C1E4Q2_9RHOO|nr:hypothetical protein [Oryzomicrobium terrae]QEL63843.1 hypothetical protein OTERR_03670 [Oryzomicrobium terrae]